MNINNILFLENTLISLKNCNNIDNLETNLKNIISLFGECGEINILFFDDKINKFKNVLKNFEIADDYFSKEKLNLFYNIFSEISKKSFIINDDFSIPDDISDKDDIYIKTLSLPLIKENKIFGFFRINFKNKIFFSYDNLKIFSLFSDILSLKTENILLKKQKEVTTSFYNALKNIAKIIETQYDFQYIIPLIGEMIDKFVLNHLIYVFIKHDNKYSLFWPSACWNKNIYEMIDIMDEKQNYQISEDKKIGCFPIKNETEILGCVIAYSTIDKLTDEEINYIKELTKQSALTIEKAKEYSELLKNSSEDALTGLNNRHLFEKRLKEEYSIANRQKSPLCAIMTDIDFFKTFNDTYGHSVGDLVLKTISNEIKKCLRDYDIPSRYGGEEFCILLPQTSLKEAQIVAERLRSSVEKTKIEIFDKNIQQNKFISVTISIGLAELNVNDLAEDLYIKADSALYKAKESGRNKVVAYENK